MEKMTPEEREMELQKQKDQFRFVRENRRKKKLDGASTSTVTPLIIGDQPAPIAARSEKNKAPTIVVELEGDVALTESLLAQSSPFGEVAAPDVIAAEVAAGALPESSQETSLLRKRKRPSSPSSSPFFHLLRTATNAEELRAMMETLTEEEMECELNYLHLWHGGMCDAFKSFNSRIRETQRAAQQDRDRAMQAEGKVWRLEDELKKANQAVEDQKAELTLLQKKLTKAEGDVVIMKTKHEAESLKLGTSLKELEASLEQLKESSSKEKEELLGKLQKAVEDRQKELYKLQDEHVTEMMTEAADTYADLMQQVHILYPDISLEGVHYLHSVVDGKVMKPGDSPNSWVEVVLPEPMHTSDTTKLADVVVPNDSSDAQNMDIDPKARILPQANFTSVQDEDMEQGGNQQGPEGELLP